MDGLSALQAALLEAGLPGGMRRDYPIGALTTYRVGGPAAGFVRPADKGELEAVAGAAAIAGVEVLVVGFFFWPGAWIFRVTSMRSVEGPMDTKVAKV